MDESHFCDCDSLWRERVGIEPTQDATNAQQLVLKTRRHTSTYPPPCCTLPPAVSAPLGAFLTGKG